MTPDITPGSPEWLALLTASRIHRVIGGRGAWESLAREMRATDKRRGGSKATAHGIANEPRALALYSLETGRQVMKPGFRFLAGSRRIGASVDGITDHAHVLEVKCPVVLGTHLLHRQGVIAEAYWWQVQCGLWVWEEEHADFISFFECLSPDEELAIVPLTRDDRAIAKLSDASFAFLDWFDAGGGTGTPHDFLNPGASGLPKLF
jgi:hypothetical protein